MKYKVNIKLKYPERHTRVCVECKHFLDLGVYGLIIFYGNTFRWFAWHCLFEYSNGFGLILMTFGGKNGKVGNRIFSAYFFLRRFLQPEHKIWYFK